MKSIPGWQDLWKGTSSSCCALLSVTLPPAQVEQVPCAVHKTREVWGGSSSCAPSSADTEVSWERVLVGLGMVGPQGKAGCSSVPGSALPCTQLCYSLPLPGASHP